MRFRRWIWFASALWAGLAVPALRGASTSAGATGKPYTIDKWGAGEGGLPQHSVLAMVQTRDGYLWLGTLGGLVRFDGKHFKVFDESNTPELGSSRIVGLFEDREGNLWVGTEGAGVVVVKAGKFESLNIGRGSWESRLMSACQDAAGAVWLYTADGQLYRHRNGATDRWPIDTGTYRNYRGIIVDSNGLLRIGTDVAVFSLDPATAFSDRELRGETVRPANRIDFLLASRQSGYWCLTDGGIQRWTDPRAGPAVRANVWPQNVRVGAACEDREGNLVVGTLGAGLFWFDASGEPTKLSTEEGLANNYVVSLHLDREGTLWVGTDGGGLNRLRRHVFEVVEPCRGWVVQSVCEDHEGGLWIGANVNDVALWQDATLRRFNLGQRSVRSVLVDGRSNVWAGTWGPRGLWQLLGEHFQPALETLIHPRVAALHEDRAGRLWLGTEGGLTCRDEKDTWRRFTRQDGLSADAIQALADDAEGNLWIGTIGGGLNRLRDGRFTAFRKSDGCPSDRISALCVDAEGVVWVGTFGSGLGRFHNGRWTRYTTREGLVSNSIGYVIEDGQGNLWIGTTAGLMRVPKKALNEFAPGRSGLLPCHVYDEADGLPSGECSVGAAGRSRAGKLWFPTIAGVASVDPARLKPNPVPPPVAIESVLIDGQAQGASELRASWSDAITVPAGKERVEIQYTSLNLSSADRARFKYRLEGHESSWSEAGNARFARYIKLPPGRYRFQVTASNEDGLWNETGASLALVVLPPFWRTWWFLSIAGVCLLGAVVGTVHYFSTQKLQRQVAHLRQQEAIEKERARIARDIHDQVGANLTQVSLLGELVETDKDSPADVETHAKQITQTARETTRALDEIVWTVNPSNDTLEGLVNYICKNAQDFLAVAGLRYRLDVPPQLPAIPIPPDLRHNVFLAAKESVTNIVRHAQASAAWIRLRLDGDRFTLEIEDNGRGLGDVKSKSHRHGLRNMRKRMEDVGGEFSIGPGAEGGTLVRLTAPLPER